MSDRMPVPRRGVQQALFSEPLPHPTEPTPALDDRLRRRSYAARAGYVKRDWRKGRQR